MVDGVESLTKVNHHCSHYFVSVHAVPSSNHLLILTGHPGCCDLAENQIELRRGGCLSLNTDTTGEE